MINADFVKYENNKSDEYIRLDTTIIGIDNLIANASTVEEANALFKAEDVVYSQQRHLTDAQPVKHGRWIVSDTQRHVEVTYECSECHHEVVGEYEKTPFCSRCGARMSEV